VSFDEAVAAMGELVGRWVSFRTVAAGVREWAKLEGALDGVEEDPEEPGIWMLGFRPGDGIAVFDRREFLRAQLVEIPGVGVYSVSLQLRRREWRSRTRAASGSG
jgi:hypothetical protein